MALNLDNALDGIGGMLIGAFGKQAAVGMLMGLLDDVTPLDVYRYVRGNASLFPDVAEEDWPKIAKVMRKAHLEDIDIDFIVAAFQKSRPDLLSVVINHPSGMKWLNCQLTELKSHVSPQ